MASKKQRAQTIYVEQLEMHWHALYDSLCAMHKKMKDSEGKEVIDGVLHARMSKEDYLKLLSDLTEFVTLNNVLIEWGESLKTSHAVAWGNENLAAFIGFKNGSDMDAQLKKMEESFKDQKVV